MFKTPKQLLTLAAVSAILAGGLYWWWGRLIAGSFSQCVGGSPAAGVDCAHTLPFYAATGLAGIALVLLLAAAVRAMRPSHRSAT